MMAASGLVVVSGVIMVYLQTGIKAVFIDWKTWSSVVIAKILLTTLMGGLALFQTLKWKKRQTFTTQPLVRTEWLVGLVVIVLGVWMSQISYPIAVETYDETLTADHIEAEVNIDQLQVGKQMMLADIAEWDGHQPEDVQVQVSMSQHDMVSDDLTAERNEEGKYAVELPFSMSGTWLLEITATYPDTEKIEWKDELFIAGEGN